MKKLLYVLFSLFFIAFIFYFGAGYYIANSILYIEAGVNIINIWGYTFLVVTGSLFLTAKYLIIVSGIFKPLIST